MGIFGIFHEALFIIFLNTYSLCCSGWITAVTSPVDASLSFSFPFCCGPAGEHFVRAATAPVLLLTLFHFLADTYLSIYLKSKSS